jgi:hypothetical protein
MPKNSLVKNSGKILKNVPWDELAGFLCVVGIGSFFEVKGEGNV